ncbi:unnamed protein product [Macrosiphum euphorbiae]|uniref:Uncharacterized protein n=1 Tax=Macrosiphum euphorbiae TaxID=13131 RepID=A0AAV0Y537_9HEMI|nr:unnamed protein product [Macrosiphum euphorbiae]
MTSNGKKSDENLKEAIRRRGVIKGKLTRFGTFFNGFLKNDKRNFTELKLRCDKLNALYDEFDTVHTEIEEFDDSADQQSENEFFAIQAAALEEGENHRLSNIPTSTQPYQQNDSQLFQLHRIRLPEFSGGYENWQPFRDNFSVMVDKKNISAVQKLQYLRLSLSGSAAQLINSLEITDVNYQVAFELLTKRFENKRLIVQSHLSKLFAVQRLEKESAIELRVFYNTFTRHLGALMAVGTFSIHCCLKIIC